MSALEVDTIGGSSIAHHIANAEAGRRTLQHDDLINKYNFSRVGSSTTYKKLPVEAHKEDIIDAIDSNPVVVISGHTGCGKTTQIPQYILRYYAEKNQYVNIVVTQPRRIAAQSVARRVANQNGWELGKLVGYKVGMDKEHQSPDTKLLYCTTGVLKKIIVGGFEGRPASTLVSHGFIIYFRQEESWGLDARHPRRSSRARGGHGLCRSALQEAPA
jgi:HrpA-like RNA helicase